ncbi:MAG: nicotinate phosphoribosyltransferase [Treponema sp.]|jgi:nicotinate phosphoribosyltransferase|nr:nicotinate phosphoribosyltransferase [Treponema sp.]
MNGTPQGSSALFTDFYSLTMAHGYWKQKIDYRAVFEMFFRRQPFGSGFAIFAGLEDLLDSVESFRYSEEDIAYLRSLKTFDDNFLDYLSRFRFTGSIWAADEGSVIFPHEPLIRVDSSLIESQILEGMLLNTVNFQSLIATKTARVYLASGRGSIMEFGLRRAQGPDGAMSASRAAFIGGASGTSNTLAGKVYGMPALGTMAHSWIMSFPSEEDAFRAYAEIYPERAVFLIDTYDTLKSGTPNAIKVGRELAAQGYNFGVRLDSGDIHYLSVEVRKMLDQAGFPQATITVSNDLDEHIIHTLREAGAPVNFWGVGTQMVTGGTEAAFTGVYKLAAREDGAGKLIPAIKFSDNPEKTTNPGIKQVWRIKDPQGMAVADVLTLVDDQGEEILEKKNRYAFWHPSADYRHFYHEISGSAERLLKPRMEQGRILARTSLAEIRERVNRDLDSLDPSYKRLLNPHVYKVSITGRLRDLKLKLIQDYLGDL